jgi:ribosomal protein S18 acetylase RimI-like enzyme
VEFRQLAEGQGSEVLAAPELFDEPPDPEAVRAYLHDRRNLFLLAYEDGRAVGFLRGTELDQVKTTRHQFFLYEIAVLEGFRRRGIAGGLIAWLLRYARERSFEEVFVFTDPANRAAVALYRSTGAITETPADRMFVYRL